MSASSMPAKAERDTRRIRRARVIRAEFTFTRATGMWTDRNWSTIPAEVREGMAVAEIPPFTTACYFNLFDARDCCVSSEHDEQQA